MISVQFVVGTLPDDDPVQACHRLTLEPSPRSVSAARRFVRSHVPDLPVETGESLELMTSELVTNAVLHARTIVNVEVVVAATSVVVGVHDQDRVTSLQTPYGDREGGWGLGLVGALAHSWSMVSHPQGGKTVWFRLLRAEAHSVSNGAAARTDADRRDS
ncbi:ATP-binding protein [Kineococcus sp. NBC_00420]|uniref:ATP-binding protein n=1 Tax=unclassified Kineococcus TaxID=2621656 RepID=UPI002E1F27A8